MENFDRFKTLRKTHLFRLAFDSNQDSIFLDPITENEVKIEIGQLNVNKSGGYDEMSPTVIKAISNILDLQ